MVLVAGAHADVLLYSDVTLPSGNDAADPVDSIVFPAAYDSGTVYVRVTLTFDNPIAEGIDTTESYGGLAFNDNGNIFGQSWQNPNLSRDYYGTADLAGTPIALAEGTPYDTVYRFDLDANTLAVWVNPILFTGVESAPDYYDPGHAWNAQLPDLRFRKGNNSDNAITFSNIAVYDNGDSPFLIPEPATSLLLAGGLLLIARRRRR
jgi:hypothetical protein